MNSSFYKRKRNELVNKLMDNSILVLLSGVSPFRNADAHHEFNVNSNFYYLTGINEEGIILLISKINNEVKETLFIKRRDPDLVKWVGENIQEEEAKNISGIDNVNFVDNFEKLLTFHLFMQGVSNVYLDVERYLNNANDYNKDNLTRKIKNDYPHAKIENVYPLITRMRAIKEKEEVEEIKKAIDITNLGLQAMMKAMKPNLKEYEIEAYFDFVMKQNGVKIKAFPTIAAAGKRACVLHYENNDGIVNDNEFIMFDLGARSAKKYCADISRTYPINGKFSPRQKELYNIVLNTMELVIKSIKPGISILDLNNIVINNYAVELKRIGLIKDDSEVKNYYYHGVSHMLGLDTHDVGYNRSEPLLENMVLTVEPGLYIEQEGVGIRIEDNVLVTKDGCINLSSNIIKSVEEIEEFMKK